MPISKKSATTAPDTAVKTEAIKLGLTRLPKNTFTLVCQIPWSDITSASDKAIDKLGEELTIKGFRQGKAPRSLVISHLAPDNITQKALSFLLPDLYTNQVKSNDLKPIVNPKIEILSSKPNEAWVVRFTSCELPVIDLTNWQERYKASVKTDAIWTPGKSPVPDDTNKTADTSKTENRLKVVFDWLLANINFDLSDLIVDEETNRHLSSFLTQIEKLGMNLDQYLSSSGKTADQVRAEHRTRAEQELKLDFLLTALSDYEKIVATPEDIDKAISTAKDAQEKTTLESQRYLLASFIRRQKTLDFLKLL